MSQPANFFAIVLMATFLAGLIVLMIVLVIWARKRSTGAIMTGALLSVFAPDPTVENQIKLVEAAKSQQSEEDEDGEPE